MARRIVLLGRSLAIDSIAAAIGALPELELFHTPDPPESAADVAAHIIAFAPNAVIFDLTAGFPDKTLLQRLMSLRIPLLGFDLEQHQMLALSGEHIRLVTRDDLVHALAAPTETQL
jgi:hypothetical protein